MRAPTIWIAVRDLSRSGVPLVLLRLLRASTPVQRGGIHVIAIQGGPIAEDLKDLAASLTVLEPSGRRSLPGALVAGTRSVAQGSRVSARTATAIEIGFWRRQLRHLPDPNVLVLNGAGAWPLVGVVPRQTPVVLHLHELGIGLDRSIPIDEQHRAFRRARYVMAVSRPVADLALSRGAIAHTLVQVPGMVARGEISPTPTSGPDVVVRDHPFDPDQPFVCGIGEPGWRKGTDRLAPLAFELERRSKTARVVWIGGRPQGDQSHWIEADDPVTWLEPTSCPWPIAERAAAIVIPSREDPLPLVALEAGLRGKAVVAMATGGLPELLGSGRGISIADQSLVGLIDATELVLRDRAYSLALGDELRRYVELHYLSELVTPLWWSVIEEAASDG